VFPFEIAKIGSASMPDGAAREPTTAPMGFQSILNPSSDVGSSAEVSEPPAYVADLNLDQVVASITAGKQEYNLAPLFDQALKSLEAVEYRQQVMRDLENNAHYAAVARFAVSMRSVRERLTQAGKLHYRYQKEAWLLDAADLYCQCVRSLLAELRRTPPFSSGLAGFFAFLDGYVASLSSDAKCNPRRH
jgi:DNA mismatch repair protein MutS